MEREYFQPQAGRKYLNRNGVTYFCVESLDNNSAKFLSVTSGYTLTAYGCQKYEDGTIEWDGSIGNTFEDVNKYVENYGFDSSLLVRS